MNEDVTILFWSMKKDIYTKERLERFTAYYSIQLVFMLAVLEPSPKRKTHQLCVTASTREDGSWRFKVRRVQETETPPPPPRLPVLMKKAMNCPHYNPITHLYVCYCCGHRFMPSQCYANIYTREIKCTFCLELDDVEQLDQCPCIWTIYWTPPTSSSHSDDPYEPLPEDSVEIELQKLTKHLERIEQIQTRLDQTVTLSDTIEIHMHWKSMEEVEEDFAKHFN